MSTAATSLKQFEYPTLLLVEHGQTEFAGNGDQEERIHGTKFDLPLTREGHGSAQAVADKLKGHDIASLKTSPMKRAKETAEYVGEATGQEPEEDKGLMPLDAGYLSGMTHDTAKARMEYYVKNPHKQIPGSEGTYGDWWETASSRMAKRLKETERIHRDSGQGAVDVLHSSEIASMPDIVKGEPPKLWSERQIPGPGRISAVEKKGGSWKFKEAWNG